MKRTQKDWALRGPAHQNWKDDAASVALHQRVQRLRGKATEHLCVDCDGPAVDWSRIHGRDGKRIDDYAPRCKKCHHKYDRTNWEVGIRNRNMTNTSKAATETNRKRWQDPEHRAKMSNAVAESNRRRGGSKARMRRDGTG
jgi:hypothetical protein